MKWWFEGNERSENFNMNKNWKCTVKVWTYQQWTTVYWLTSSLLFHKIDFPICLQYRYYWTVPLILDFLFKVSPNITYVQNGLYILLKCFSDCLELAGWISQVGCEFQEWRAQIWLLFVFVFLIPCKCSGIQYMFNQPTNQSINVYGISRIQFYVCTV